MSGVIDELEGLVPTRQGTAASREEIHSRAVGKSAKRWKRPSRCGSCGADTQDGECPFCETSEFALEDE